MRRPRRKRLTITRHGIFSTLWEMRRRKSA
jgi:hypothetical protein